MQFTDGEIETQRSWVLSMGSSSTKTLNYSFLIWYDREDEVLKWSSGFWALCLAHLKVCRLACHAYEINSSEPFAFDSYSFTWSEFSLFLTSFACLGSHKCGNIFYLFSFLFLKWFIEPAYLNLLDNDEAIKNFAMYHPRVFLIATCSSCQGFFVLICKSYLDDP